MCIFIKLGKNINDVERMNSIKFESHKSKVKVTMDLYGNNLVNMIELFCASSSNLAYILTMMGR